MTHILDDRIAQAKAQVERERELRAALAPRRERLTEQTYLVRRIETCLGEIDARLRSLESFGLGSLVESLFGAKQKKIDDNRAQLAEFESQFSEANTQLEELERGVAAMEAELTELEPAKAALAAAYDEKAKAMVESGSPDADKFRRIEQEFSNARALVTRVERTAESGRQLLKHLETLDRTVRNAKSNRRMAGAAMGAVGAIVKSAVASTGPKAVVRFVQDSLQRFTTELAALPLSDHPDDADLFRIRNELESYQARLAADIGGISGWDQIDTLPAQQETRAALSHLKTMAAELRKTVEAIEQQRAAVLERT